MNRLKVLRLVFFCLFGITISAAAVGCGGPAAVTDEPVSTEEQSELDDQLSNIEQPGAK